MRKIFLWAENDVTAFIIFEKLIKKPRRETHKAYRISKVHNIMQIDNKRVANLRCSEYFTQRHISQKCHLNTFEIIIIFLGKYKYNFEGNRMEIFRLQKLLYRIYLKSCNVYNFPWKIVIADWNCMPFTNKFRLLIHIIFVSHPKRKSWYR